jgi:23S rRNA (pseudouridine1915-N3)-methyltransferase
MHRIGLISVGKIKTPWIKEGCEVFCERIGHSCKFSEQVLSAGTKEEEHARILKALNGIDGVIVILDEIGKELSSPQFASWIGKERDTGRSITFILGGAFGLSDAIRSKGQLVLALSRMTLPHELCQLFFLEQLYRAETILAGTGYHH